MVATETFTKLTPLGETIDRLTILELRPRSFPTWGLVSHLYETVRNKIGGPLSLLAAERLMQAVKPDDLVIIITGFAVPPWIPIGESDGPLGAASLARALNYGLKARALVLTDDYQIDLISSTCKSAELRVYPPKDIAIPQATVVQAFPLSSPEASRQEAKRILDELAPSAVVSIERAGRSSNDIYHTAFGSDMSSWNARIDYVLTEAKERGILTIGIGDLGNEAGMGTIVDEVRRVVPNATKCRCPCAQGVATAVDSEITVAAICSNFGAYGITACISALLGKPDVLQRPELEEHMIRECVRSGGMEGAQANPSLEIPVDMIERDACVSVVRLMGSAVRQSLKEISFYRGEMEQLAAEARGM